MSDSAAPTQSVNAQNLELNVGDQFIFALDVSASMRSTDCPGGLSRIEYSKEQARVFATEAGKYDPDGADYLTFGHQVKKFYNLAPDKAIDLISSLKADEGSTDTAGVIRAAWERAQELRAAGEKNNIVLMIITDGEPNDREGVKALIRDIAASLPDGEGFGIIFLTVGTIDPGLQSFLTDLDDNLNAAHDIVDVKDFMSVNFLEAFVGAVHD